jgi:shikimate dehydrogenase
MRLAGVVGWPVGHSRSPAMHNAAYAALGLDWRYVKLPVAPDRLAETVRALPASGYAGVNVTLPHKLAARELADEAAPAAAAIGAANMLTFESDEVIADNTDAAGFLDALATVAAKPAAGRELRAMVLGAGGAARAVAWALRGTGAAEVLVWNRTPARAEALAAELGVRQVDRPQGADLLVNATSVGLEPGSGEAEVLEALGLRELEPPPVVVDLVYGSEPTAFCAWAERAGARVVDGLEVLVRQGARSFERWTGRAAPVEVMRAAARAES